MGCDYYIIKALDIYFKDEDGDRDNYLSFVIDRENGYYYYLYDSDDETYEKKVADYINDCLTPKMKPIILFDNKFINSKCESKYKLIVEQFMKENGKNFNDITKIIKVENRYERT
jgi:hypothetical protein